MTEPLSPDQDVAAYVPYSRRQNSWIQAQVVEWLPDEGEYVVRDSYPDKRKKYEPGDAVLSLWLQDGVWSSMFYAGTVVAASGAEDSTLSIQYEGDEAVYKVLKEKVVKRVSSTDHVLGTLLEHARSDHGHERPEGDEIPSKRARKNKTEQSTELHMADPAIYAIGDREEVVKCFAMSQTEVHPLRRKLEQLLQHREKVANGMDVDEEQEEEEGESEGSAANDTEGFSVKKEQSDDSMDIAGEKGEGD